MLRTIELVKRYVLKVSGSVVPLRNRQVSPHTIRHTTAIHLIRVGVDIDTIGACLGHVWLDMTNVYAEINLEMKAKAISRCEITTPALIKTH